MPDPPATMPTCANSFTFQGIFGMGPLMNIASPGLRFSCMYLVSVPVSYFLTRRCNSPSRSGGDTGVYGRTTGLPLSSTSALGSEDLTTKHDATGSRDASPSGSSKTNLDSR